MISPSFPLSNRYTVTNAMNAEQLAFFEGVTERTCNTFEKCKKSNNDALCNGVTV
jgi:hypothetical protein